jgi:deazaflavin-dependent oxidoreductase (nitroreductase family)
VTEIDEDELTSDPTALAEFNRAVVEEFRANGGRVGGRFEGGNLLLLHTTGAKSGRPRLTPLAYLTVDDRILVIGSYAGAPRDPAWVHNLRAHPRAHVEVGTESYDVHVRELPDAEREAAVARVGEISPVLAEHQANTTRTIPLFELVRI